MNYGLSLMGKGDFKGAIEAYKRAEITNPYYSYLFINFGIAYGSLNDSVQAISNFEKGRALALMITMDTYTMRGIVLKNKNFRKQGSWQKKLLS
ncbi:hypothetical protein [Niabella hibiscisoli]|uniref:hypothetical protein n=1 Tax=Niabella hibiscisoli TaxID=1825928 RepID=UPI001F0EB91D|nr:hypothetical protein [Niabella hibiscisoli]MCH5718096.1 hypothetical protein [Niabella hibiscisoli]